MNKPLRIKTGKIISINNCLMFRCQTTADGDEIIRALATLTSEHRDVLKREFSATGFGKNSTILLYYSPAMLDNLRKAFDRTTFFKMGVQTLSQIMCVSRQDMERNGTVEGVIQVRMDTIAKHIRDASGFSTGSKVEVYNNQNFGLSAKLVTNSTYSSKNKGILSTNSCKSFYTK